MVPIKFPRNIAKMLDSWASCVEENVGLVLTLRRPDPQRG
jgi:hypothetical protein